MDVTMLQVITCRHVSVSPPPSRGSQQISIFPPSLLLYILLPSHVHLLLCFFTFPPVGLSVCVDWSVFYTECCCFSSYNICIIWNKPFPMLLYSMCRCLYFCGYFIQETISAILLPEMSVRTVVQCIAQASCNTRIIIDL